MKPRTGEHFTKTNEPGTMGVDEMGLNTEHFTFDAGSKLAELWTYGQNIALLRTTRPMWESRKVSQSTT